MRQESWRTVRVFISGTFRDMHAERDHLVRFVFPRLCDKLFKRRVRLVDGDLRWGVTSEQDALEVCHEMSNIALYTESAAFIVADPSGAKLSASARTPARSEARRPLPPKKAGCS